MNKLVSKNPVLRFKLGKKIVFAQKGSGRWFYRGKEVFLNKEGTGYVIDDNGLYVVPGLNRNLVLADKVGRGAYKVGNDWYKIGGNGKPAVFKSNVNSNKTSNSNNKSTKKPTIKSPGSSLKKLTQNVKKEKYNPIQFLDLVTHNWGLNKNNMLDNTILIPYGIGQNPTVEHIPTVIEKPSTINNKSSQKRLYTKQNMLKRNEELTLYQFLAPESKTTELILSDITSKINLPIYELIPSAPNITIPTNNQLPTLLANRSDIRQLIRDITGNDPYDYTFLLRRALRKYINGEDYNSNLLKIFGSDLSKFDKYKASNLSQYYKQGGQLPSRNPVLRFKLGGVLKFQNAGNLPTAPKAENRYRNGRKTWNTPEYKEVSSASNIYGDPFASKIAMEVSNNGNDTIFYETPGRWLPVKLKTRTASKKNQNLQTIPYYYGLPTNETKTIIISPEYEILKRRFNTAWNLAK